MAAGARLERRPNFRISFLDTEAQINQTRELLTTHDLLDDEMNLNLDACLDAKSGMVGMEIYVNRVPCAVLTFWQPPLDDNQEAFCLALHQWVWFLDSDMVPTRIVNLVMRVLMMQARERSAMNLSHLSEDDSTWLARTLVEKGFSKEDTQDGYLFLLNIE